MLAFVFNITHRETHTYTNIYVDSNRITRITEKRLQIANCLMLWINNYRRDTALNPLYFVCRVFKLQWKLYFTLDATLFMLNYLLKKLFFIYFISSPFGGNHFVFASLHVLVHEEESKTNYKIMKYGFCASMNYVLVSRIFNITHTHTHTMHVWWYFVCARRFYYCCLLVWIMLARTLHPNHIDA